MIDYHLTGCVRVEFHPDFVCDHQVAEKVDHDFDKEVLDHLVVGEDVYIRDKGALVYAEVVEGVHDHNAEVRGRKKAAEGDEEDHDDTGAVVVGHGHKVEVYVQVVHDHMVVVVHDRMVVVDVVVHDHEEGVAMICHREGVVEVVCVHMSSQEVVEEEDGVYQNLQVFGGIFRHVEVVVEVVVGGNTAHSIHPIPNEAEVVAGEEVYNIVENFHNNYNKRLYQPPYCFEMVLFEFLYCSYQLTTIQDLQ